MDSALLIVGIIGNIISVLLFLSPVKTFWRIVRSKSTEEFESAPYVVTLLNAELWLYYGLTKPDGLLVATINAVGVLLEAIYVLLFLLHAPPPARARTAILVGALDVMFFGVVLLAARLAIHELDLRIAVVGAMCACLNVCMYVSPLAAMKKVIGIRSVEYMPFLLSFFLFLNGGVWALYAILDKDVFLGIPNGIGFFLGAIQLVIYVIFMNSKTSSKEPAEEGCQNSPLLHSNARAEQIDASIHV